MEEQEYHDAEAGDAQRTEGFEMKNRILITITAIAGIWWAFWACCADSESMVPTWCMIPALAWLLLFALANKDYKKE